MDFPGNKGIGDAVEKKKRTLNNIFKLLFIITAVILTSTCENLLRIGMGDEIDLQPPSNTLTSPESGAFISGNIVFQGTVSDDQG